MMSPFRVCAVTKLVAEQKQNAPLSHTQNHVYTHNTLSMMQECLENKLAHPWCMHSKHLSAERLCSLVVGVRHEGHLSYDGSELLSTNHHLQLSAGLGKVLLDVSVGTERNARPTSVKVHTMKESQLWCVVPGLT